MKSINIALSPGRDQFLVTFDYDPNLVAAVKSLPTRRWDNASKTWIVPASAAEHLGHMLVRLENVQINVPADVQARVTELAAARAAAKEASRATDAAVDLPAPAGLEYLPYQKAGIAYGAGKAGVLIGDEMGLGKTIQAIGIANTDREIRNALIICPASLRLNWQREWTKWDVHGRMAGVAYSDLPFPKTPVVVMNYDILKKHIAAVRARSWDMLVVDEAHYLKNFKAQRTKLVMGHVNRQDPGKSIPPLTAKRRVFLTGTPILNRPIEAWGLVSSLAPAEFPSWWQFATRYCAMKETRYGRDVTGASNLDELQDKLRASCMIRRLKKDVLKELPPKRRQVIEFEDEDLDGIVGAEIAAWKASRARLARLRDAVELAKAGTEAEYRAAVAALQEGATAEFTAMSRMRHDTAVAKIPLVVDHLRECIEAGGKIIAFAHHKDVVRGIMREFPDIAVSVTGDTPMADRQAAVDRFQSDPGCMLFVGNIQAAGVGLTLTASSHVVFAELDWVPGNISQAEDRAHRIGQQDSVLVQHLVLAGSLDATMARRLVDKQAIIDRALDDPYTRELASDPILPVDEEPATRGVTRQAIEKEAAAMPPVQVAAVHQCLRILAGMCDGAVAKDDHGFNAADAFIGKSLAEWERLTPKQAALGRKIVQKYKRQLPAALLATARGAEA